LVHVAEKAVSIGNVSNPSLLTVMILNYGVRVKRKSGRPGTQGPVSETSLSRFVYPQADLSLLSNQNTFLPL